MTAKDETWNVRNRSSTRLLMLVFLAALLPGCAGLLLIGGSDANAIVFETGELRSNEAVPLAELDLACQKAVEMLGYEDIVMTHEEDSIHLTARTAGGDPVELQLAAMSSSRTELRIRVGVLGNEARSRLVLEQIHQSL